MDSNSMLETNIYLALNVLSPLLFHHTEYLDLEILEPSSIFLETPCLFESLTEQSVSLVEKPGNDKRNHFKTRCLSDCERVTAIDHIARIHFACQLLQPYIESVSYSRCAGYVANRYRYFATATKIYYDGTSVKVFRGGNINRPFGKGCPCRFKITLKPELQRILKRKTISG